MISTGQIPTKYISLQHSHNKITVSENHRPPFLERHPLSIARPERDQYFSKNLENDPTL